MRIFRNRVAYSVLLGALAFTQGRGLADPIKIMPLGDSITVGSGMSGGGGYRVFLWRQFLADGLDAEFVGSQQNGPDELESRRHEGHSGWVIRQIDAIISDRLATYQPDLVLLMIGTNDVNRSKQLETAPDRLAALIDKITDQSPDTTLVVAAITPIRNPAGDARAVTFNSFIPAMVEERAAQGQNIMYVDMHSALDPTSDLRDNLHPNVRGYEKMAGVWYEAITTLLKAGCPAGR